MCMFVCTFTDMNTNARDQIKLMLQICLSYLQFLIMNITFVSMTCVSHWQMCFSKGFFSHCQWNLCSHGHTCTTLVSIKMCLSINDKKVWCWVPYTTKGSHSTWLMFNIHALKIIWTYVMKSTNAYVWNMFHCMLLITNMYRSLLSSPSRYH